MLINAVKKSIYRYGVIRWMISAPMIIIYSVSFALLIPEYKTPLQSYYEELNAQMTAEKSGITTPISLPSDLFQYSSIWQEMAGENPLVHTLILSSLEDLIKSINFLKDIQDKNETMIKIMIRNRMKRLEQKRIDELISQDIFGSAGSKGEYFKRLFEQLFSRQGLKKLGAKYSETDAEVYFNLLCRYPEEKHFRRLLGALVLNVPYYLVIKNSINEYYQNSNILIPVDLFSFTLFMMFLDGVKNKDTRPTIDECRSWVFSVIVPDDEKRKELQSRSFSFQQIIREEMIMPNPGYLSKVYHEKKHKAVDIASERGTMIRSPVTGTVKYYEKSPKKSITGNFIIIKDESSEYNIFICHMDDKDFIEEHSTEGALAEPIANLEPDWTHPLKKGEFFQVVGSSGKSTGAHTHIQIARRNRPYRTFNFLSVNKPHQRQFNSYLRKNRYWQAYSRNEELLLSVFGMAVNKYDSTRHFADRDPETLKEYKRLQNSYTPVSATVASIDISLEEIPESILRTFFSRTVQEQVINNRYDGQLKFYRRLIIQQRNLLTQKIPPAPALPAKAIPLTPWLIVQRRRREDDDASLTENTHDSLFYHALNKFFLYKILQMNYTPREIRDQLLSDPGYTPDNDQNLYEDLPVYPSESFDERVTVLKKYIQGIMHFPVDLSYFYGDGFCSSIFEAIVTACKNQGVPLDSNFGFFRYDTDELEKSYQVSQFINFPDTREFVYNKKYDESIRLFFLDMLELAAEHKYSGLFRQLFIVPEESSTSILNKILSRIYRAFAESSARIKNKILRRIPPPEPEVSPQFLYPVFQQLVENIVKPVPYIIKEYEGNTPYRAEEASLFFSLIYGVYFSERECYMQLFPREELTGVIDSIGSFDSIFRFLCENTARKHLIDSEHSRIMHELETAEKEIDIFKKSKKQLQEDFRKETVSIQQLDDYISRHSEIFSSYFLEEEKFSGKISYLEYTLVRYRNECTNLKKEKIRIQKDLENKLNNMAMEIEALKSKSTIDQDRFRIEMKNISYYKEKADLKIIELKRKIEELYAEFRNPSGESVKDLAEAELLLKKYKKAIMIRNTRISEQEIIINELRDNNIRLKEELENFQKTLFSDRKKISEEEYKRMTDTIVKLKEEIRLLRRLLIKPR